MSFSVSLATVVPEDKPETGPAASPTPLFAWPGRLSGLAPALGGGGGEAGRAREPAVEARPALAVGQALLEPVEAAEGATELVDHVDQGGLARARNDRAAVLQQAVVAQDDMENGLGLLGREVVDRLD